MLLETKRTAYLGVLLALNQILLIIPIIMQYSTIYFFSVAALLVGIVILEYNLRYGIVFYIASSLLSFIISVNKIEIITYIGFFALYSIVKYLIELYVNQYDKSVIIEILLKELFFNTVMIIGYLIMIQFVKFYIQWWMILGVEVFFIVYDYLFGYFIHVYIDKIKPRIKSLK